MSSVQGLTRLGAGAVQEVGMADRNRIFKLTASMGFGALTAASLFATGAPVVAAATATPDIVGHVLGQFSAAQPPTSAQCLAANGLACYDPSQVEAHYGLDSLHDSGVTG